MQLERNRLRTFMLSRYVTTMRHQPLAVVDYLIGHLIVLSTHLPLSVRFLISERLRDCADAVEVGRTRESKSKSVQ